MKPFVAGLMVLTLATASLTVPAESDDVRCAVPRAFVSVSLRSALPAPLQKLFEDFVMPGQDFNKTDVGIPGSGLLFVWNKYDVWIVASAHGGIALFTTVQVFRISADGKTASDITPAREPDRSAPCPLATHDAENLAN